MRFIWEEEDIKVAYKIKYKGDSRDIFIIGYMPFKNDDVYQSRYTYISLDDGQVMCDGKTKKELAELFTLHAMIPLTK